MHVFELLVEALAGWAPWIQWQFAIGFDEVNQTMAAHFRARLPQPPKSKEEE